MVRGGAWAQILFEHSRIRQTKIENGKDPVRVGLPYELVYIYIFIYFYTYIYTYKRFHIISFPNPSSKTWRTLSLLHGSSCRVIQGTTWITMVPLQSRNSCWWHGRHPKWWRRPIRSQQRWNQEGTFGWKTGEGDLMEERYGWHKNLNRCGDGGYLSIRNKWYTLEYLKYKVKIRWNKRIHEQSS